MNTRGNERLRHLLAAEYALGTLRGPARRRFETWLRDDAELRALALQWGEYLAAFTARIAPRAPPRRVWEAIEARLPGAAHGRAATATRQPAWWDRLGFWRGLTVAFATVATIAIGLAIRPQTGALPPVAQVLPQAVATIADPKSGHPVAFVMASERGDALIVKVADDVEIPAGKDLQLWVAPRGEKVLISMGIVPASAKTTAFRLSASDVGMLTRAAAFGLSLEPAGGSKQPTHVLGLGNVMRVAR